VAEGTCEKADCTVATTGKCLLSQPVPAECPHFQLGDVSGEIPASDNSSFAVESETPNPQTQVVRKFHLGNELGTQDAIEIMRARYGHLIGVLGSTDAGKTCFLSSLYLMASAGKLPSPYEFAGSLTLQAFEDRARGLREWQDGRLPSQLVDHTFLSDKRQPSLLHLAIRESQLDRRRFDLLLTDLPGEWTDNLVLKSTNAGSFRFLQRADGIVLAVDGKLLTSDQRHVELQRMRHFTERIATDVAVSRDTPFVILVSKADEIGMQMPPAANELSDHLQTLGFPTTTVLSAAFSRKPDEIESGTGVFSAIEAILAHPAAKNPGPPVAGPEQSTRTFQGFRG
jgi:hypothetical protein